MRVSFYRLCLAICCVFISACTQFTKMQIHDQVYLKDDAMRENSLKSAGLNMTSDKGEVFTISPQTLSNMEQTRDRIEKVSGTSFEYAIVDSDYHSHLLLTHDDKEYVAFSMQFLDKHGSDPEIIAAVVAHDLAHIADSDTGDAIDRRETGFFVARQVVSVALSLVASPIAGYAGSAAMTGAEQADIALEESKVNPIGMQWLIDAGYSPCGYVKIKHYNDDNNAQPSPLKFMGSHQGINARAELAQEHLKANPATVCVLPPPAKPAEPTEAAAVAPTGT